MLTSKCQRIFLFLLELQCSSQEVFLIEIAIVYHSVTGTTQTLARAIKRGAESINGITAREIEIKGRDIIEGRYVQPATLEMLSQIRGIIFGSPTFMGSVSAQFKSFADATSDLWCEQAWSGKVAAGFTVGSNASGDQLQTIQYMQVFASQHGMLWTSLDIPGGYDVQGRNRLGAQSGLIVHTRDEKLDTLDLQTAVYLGKRVSNFVKVVGGNKI